MGAFIIQKARATPGPGITLPGAAVIEPLDNEKLLRMIDLVEDWDGDSLGAAGEQGPWQMLPSTWRQYSKKQMPYSETAWANPEPQRVLREHASWIRDQMEKHNAPQTAYTFALIWKSGWSRVYHHNERRADKEYAELAQNIYEELIK